MSNFYFVPSPFVILGMPQSGIAKDPVSNSMQPSCIHQVSLRDSIKNWILRNFATQNSKDDESDRTSRLSKNDESSGALP